MSQSTQNPLEDLNLIPRIPHPNGIPPPNGNFRAKENEDPRDPITIRRHHWKFREISQKLRYMGKTVPPPDGN